MSSVLGSRRIGVAFVSAAVVTVLGGCAVTEAINEAGRIDYRSAAKTGPGLDVPPDLVSPRREERFVVPERSAGQTTYSAYTRERAAAPRSSGEPQVVPTVPGVKLERAGDQRWLVVDQPPEKVWPVVRAFWQDLGFTIRTELPEAGILETDWAENRANLPQDGIRSLLGRVIDSVYSTGERDKFRTRLENVNGRTEIYVSHRGLVERFTDQLKERVVWQPRPSDPGLEAEFLQRLALRFEGRDASQVASAPVTAPADPQREQKAVVAQEQGVPVLRYDEPFDRAWRQVGLALDRVGFTVEDRDRSKGVFYVRYIDPLADDKKPTGFFSRMFGRGGNDRSERDAQNNRYRIVVSEQQSATQVAVRQADGGLPAGETDKRVASRIVALLQEQLR